MFKKKYTLGNNEKNSFPYLISLRIKCLIRMLFLFLYWLIKNIKCSSYNSFKRWNKFFPVDKESSKYSIGSHYIQFWWHFERKIDFKVPTNRYIYICFWIFFLIKLSVYIIYNTINYWYNFSSYIILIL